MDIYAEHDYKIILRSRVKEMARTKRSLTLQAIARQIPVQNTYLSKALRDPKTHLNEDHLFRICKILDFFPREIDYVQLLRAQALTSDSTRRAYLEAKINRMRQASQRRAEFKELDTRDLIQEINYLFNPLCMLVHVALFIEEYRINPRRLCSPLGLTPASLKQILETLQLLNFIRLESDGTTVLEVLQNQIHYGVNHPLMRTHQHLLRSKILAHLSQVSEVDKHCYMGTFAADEETFLKLRQLFRQFLKEAEPLIAKAPSKAIYQFSFDLFKWF